jgi:hypothetical protein
MKLTLHKLVASSPALAELASDTKLPVRTSYWAGKVLRKANAELQDYNETRIKLCEQFGTVSADGRKYEFSDDKLPEFQKQVSELLDTEIELPGEPFTLDKLGEATLSPASMMQLDWLIVEE